MNEEELDENEPIDPNDPEKGLDKFVKRNEERRQKEYEENKYRNRELQRRQQDGEQLEIPDMFKAGSTARTLTGLGVEIGGNFFLDAFSFIPGSQQAGSALLNLLQQKIRGGPISKGEIIAAAAASQIPFLQQARTIKKGGKLIREAKNLSRSGKFYRGVARGSTAGAIDTSVRSIIDEKRAPTVGEFATGVTAGGIFGGMFDLAPSAVKGRLGSDLIQIQDETKDFLDQVVDAATPGPVKIALKGDLIGASFTGGTSGTGGTIRQNQLMFDWEASPNAANVPQAKTGGLFRILPRITRRAKNQVTRPGGIFQKPDTLDITNGFKRTRRHRNFEEFIEDLMEADRIPAKNIDRAGFRSSSIRQNKYGVEIDLYQDYLQGYFNTYDTLDGAMRLVINNKPLTLGTGSMGAKSIEKINDINKLFKAYKLNPQSFDSGAFAPGSKTSANLLKEFADSKNLDDFLTRNTQLQRHHLLIIDDSFALVKGLTGNDLTRMRNAMNQIGLIAGNDPENLKFVPQKLHQKFVHGQVWKAFGPEWTGTSAKAKQLRNQISQLPLKDRIPFLDQLKEAMDLTNQVINNAVDEYLDTRVAGFEISLADKEDFQDFMAKLVKRDMDRTKLIDIDQPTTVKSTGKPTDKLDTEIESDIFGQGQMQDDL